MKNRSEIEIMAAILNAAVSNWEYKTTVMNNAGVSHSQLTRYLAIAVERRLVEYSEITGLYRTAEAGFLFLRKHEEMRKLFLRCRICLRYLITIQKSMNHLVKKYRFN